MDNEKLIEIAMDEMEKSYAPYSHYLQAAALEAEDGTIYTGCKVENASYPMTASAEAVAFYKAVSEGKRNFRKIALVGGSEGKITDYCLPSGDSRQVMLEFCNPMTFEVILATSPEDYKVYPLEELMPLYFGPKHR